MGVSGVSGFKESAHHVCGDNAHETPVNVLDQVPQLLQAQVKSHIRHWVFGVKREAVR